jgi:hypothetical protein
VSSWREFSSRVKKYIKNTRLSKDLSPALVELIGKYKRESPDVVLNDGAPIITCYTSEFNWTVARGSMSRGLATSLECADCISGAQESDDHVVQKLVVPESCLWLRKFSPVFTVSKFGAKYGESAKFTSYEFRHHDLFKGFLKEVFNFVGGESSKLRKK